MIVKQIRLSSQAKEQLSRLKGRTGIKNWNVLCRWALCLSLREKSIPADVEIPADSNVEMSWEVFGGEYSEIYEALVKQRCKEDGLGTDPATVAHYFRLHLHRGISYLSSSQFARDITDILSLATEDGEKREEEV